jgi:hypothetical protein
MAAKKVGEASCLATHRPTPTPTKSPDQGAAASCRRQPATSRSHPSATRRSCPPPRLPRSPCPTPCHTRAHGSCCAALQDHPASQHIAHPNTHKVPRSRSGGILPPLRCPSAAVSLLLQDHIHWQLGVRVHRLVLPDHLARRLVIHEHTALAVRRCRNILPRNTSPTPTPTKSPDQGAAASCRRHDAQAPPSACYFKITSIGNSALVSTASSSQITLPVALSYTSTRLLLWGAAGTSFFGSHFARSAFTSA